MIRCPPGGACGGTAAKVRASSHAKKDRCSGGRSPGTGHLHSVAGYGSFERDVLLHMDDAPSSDGPGGGRVRFVNVMDSRAGATAAMLSEATDHADPIQRKVVRNSEGGNECER